MYKFEEPSEIKLIILYIIENYREPIDNGQITDIFMSHDFVDYFTMQQYLNELLDTHLVDVETAGTPRLYFLTARGREAYQNFITKIPRTVREKLLLTIRAQKQKTKNKSDITATYTPLNELEYTANCSISEGGFPLMDLALTASSLEMAREICRRFREEPDKVYAALLRILTDTEKKEK